MYTNYPILNQWAQASSSNKQPNLLPNLGKTQSWLPLLSPCPVEANTLKFQNAVFRLEQSNLRAGWVLNAGRIRKMRNYRFLQQIFNKVAVYKKKRTCVKPECPSEDSCKTQREYNHCSRTESQCGVKPVEWRWGIWTCLNYRQINS